MPSRIQSKVDRAERALDRAIERADDGNAEGAVRQLAVVRRNLAAALKGAQRRSTAGSDTSVADDELADEARTGLEAASSQAGAAGRAPLAAPRARV